MEFLAGRSSLEPRISRACRRCPQRNLRRGPCAASRCLGRLRQEATVTLGQAATVRLADWRHRIGEIAEELAPLAHEERTTRWASLIRPLVDRLRETRSSRVEILSLRRYCRNRYGGRTALRSAATFPSARRPPASIWRWGGAKSLPHGEAATALGLPFASRTK